VQPKLLAIVAILILLISSIAVTSYIMLNKKPQKPFYVGVTYGGSSIQEAKELVDKVKKYTNLFILQSGPLATDIEAVNEIGDYVCAANLNYAIFGSTRSSNAYWINNITLEAKARWGEQFIGIYYLDEPGGNMLDKGVDIQARTTVNNITSGTTITTDGKITIHANLNDPFSNVCTYFPNGDITIQITDTKEIIQQEYRSSLEEKQLSNGTIIGSYKSLRLITNYYPNGTITINEAINEGTIQHLIMEHDTYEYPTQKQIPDEDCFVNNFYTAENITKYPQEILSYEELSEQHPLHTIDSAAEFFINSNKSYLENINSEQLQNESILVFTSDYGLYWWDYKGGYDIVLAQLGWNNSIAQEIGLLRGAANLQDKSWGTIITWKYNQAPYLADGEEIFEQMKTSYENGAEYVVIFNYSEDIENPNTLQEEHFQAIERFWNDVVQNSKIKHGGIKANAVLILPQNYGWGMRHPDDNIWGVWQANDTTRQIWNQVQNKSDKHGLKLDIIYEDQDYSIAGKYDYIYYWDR